MLRRRDGPGPGHYQVSTQIVERSVNGVSFASGGRGGLSDKGNGSGPGDYTPANVSEKAYARCLFGRSGRFDSRDKDTPGPCEYTPRDPAGAAERRTIGERNLKLPNVSSLTPGPGTYSPASKPHETIKSTGFARGAGRWTATQVGVIGLESPGPAAYQHEGKAYGKRIPAAAFGTSPRIVGAVPHAGAAKAPGPGSYSVVFKPYGPKISITPRRELDY